jgi:dTDP-4-amino-4,6-dideoxygalactose transaminase
MTEGARLPSGRLAIDGGIPVRSAACRWPRWPIPADDAAQLLGSVLPSGRWAISSPGNTELFERRFARMFAEYVGVRFCVPVDHGSSALVVALESLGLDYGSAVLVPAITWVATATAVLRAGLVPVLVDVDAETGCLSPESMRRDVGARAVIPVHWACAMADIPAVGAVAQQVGMTVIEDAAQAHGAEWLGRPAGSLASLGCFSMQHSKVLTGGEGGAVVTDDEDAAQRIEELRADSRRYSTGTGRSRMNLQLAETATVMGTNYCLSEFSAAVLCAQLGMLDRQHDVRNHNHARLASMIAGIPGVRLLRNRPEQTKMSIYEAAIIFDPRPAGMTIEDVADALTAELHAHFYPPRDPLHRSRLLRPWTKPGLAPLAERFTEYHRDSSYPHAEYFREHTVLVHHSVFLGTERDMADIADAIDKIVSCAERP